MPHYQVQQFFNLLSILLIGFFSTMFYLPLYFIGFLLLWAFLIEQGFIYQRTQTISWGYLSALSTTLGIVFMLVSTKLWIYFFLITIALFQKHFIHYQRRHFFNPSNFALIIGLAFFYHDVHIVLGQLGESLWIQAILILLAISILYQINRWIIPLVFTLSYLLLQYLFIVGYDPVMLFEHIYARFYSVSFTLFILFMLTDPKTTPTKPWQQFLFASTVALIATGLDRYFGFRTQHLFMALFLLSPLVPYITIQKREKKRLLYMTLTILLLALSAIIYIEMQPPYFFEMDH